MSDQYKKVSSHYNTLSHLYSLGAVKRCRANVLTEINEETSVCFVGVGQGDEAVLAAKHGACVTVVDNSAAMLEQFRSSMAKQGLEQSVKMIHQEITEFCEQEQTQFDIVVAHFFLNVFDESTMPKILKKISELCVLNGKLVIGDFWHDSRASIWVRSLQSIHWNLALFLFRRIIKNAKHPVYVYDSFVEKLGFTVVNDCRYRVLGIPMYRSIVARKKNNHH